MDKIKKPYNWKLVGKKEEKILLDLKVWPMVLEHVLSNYNEKIDLFRKREVESNLDASLNFFSFTHRISFG